MQKDARDKFLAFSFAASDILIEITPADKIAFALGQVESLSGHSKDQLVGKDWRSLFSEQSIYALGGLLKKKVYQAV